MLCVDIDAKEQDSNALMLLQKLVGCAGQSMRQGRFYSVSPFKEACHA